MCDGHLSAQSVTLYLLGQRVQIRWELGILLVWVLSHTFLGVGLNAHPKQSNRLWCKASIMRRPFPTKNGEVTKSKSLCAQCTNSMVFEIKVDILSQLPFLPHRSAKIYPYLFFVWIVNLSTLVWIKQETQLSLILYCQRLVHAFSSYRNYFLEFSMNTWHRNWDKFVRITYKPNYLPDRSIIFYILGQLFVVHNTLYKPNH